MTTEQEQSEKLPEVYMPEEAATVTAPDGRRLVFLRVTQASPLIKVILAAQPKEVTYRWAHHTGHKIYVLFVYWDSGHQVGIAIPEGVGDQVLDFLEGQTDIFITELEVQERMKENVSKEALEEVIYGMTIPIPQVKFRRQ